VHQEFHLKNQTAQQSGFHSANMMIKQRRGETIQGSVNNIAQLATSMASDRRTAATLTATNAKLDVQLETSQTYNKKLKEDSADLKANIKPA
jgi:hypothetical protein